MKLKQILTWLAPVLIAIPVMVLCFSAPKLLRHYRASVAVKQGSLVVDGFYVGMSADDFIANTKELAKDPQNPFAQGDWRAIRSEDGKTVIKMLLSFQTSNFRLVASDVVKAHHQNLECEQTNTGAFEDSIVCPVVGPKDKAVLVDKLFADQNSNAPFGVLVIVDKAHEDPKDPTTAPEAEHPIPHTPHLLDGQQSTQL